MKTASVSELRVELKEPGATKMTVVVPMIFRVVISPVGTTQHVERNQLQSTNSWTSRNNAIMFVLADPSVRKTSKEQSYSRIHSNETTSLLISTLLLSVSWNLLGEKKNPKFGAGMPILD